MRYARPFLEDLACLSDRAYGEVRQKLGLVEAFPGVGSSLVEPQLLRAFGSAVLKVSAAGYDVLYERMGADENGDEVVNVLGIVAQRAVR